MAPERDREIPWRGFALLAVLLLGALSIFFLAEIERLARGSYVVVAAFPEGGGVRPGAPVWVAGRETGAVVRVDMLRPTPDFTGGIVVEAEFPGAMRDILRTGSRVRMTAGSPSSGDIVEFLPGAGAELTLADTIWGIEPGERTEELIAGLGGLARSMAALLDTVEAVADAGEARLDRLDSLGEQAEEVNDLLGAFEHELERSAASRGDLLADMERVSGAVSRFGRVLADARAALSGAPGRSEDVDALRRSLPATLSELRDRLAELQASVADPNGSLTRFRSDSALWRAVGAARAEADSLIAELSENPRSMF